MSVLNPEGKILIVGAGLGGLALAQILQAHNVPFEIFERDAAPSARKQGWAIALVESVPALKELLPKQTSDSLVTNSVNHNTGDNDELAFVNALTGGIAGKLGGKPPGEPGSLIRASREATRAYLWEQNDLPVSANKNFTHYTEDDNEVIAHFEDGTSARGSLLVGADGLHSHVLDQMIGHTLHKPVLSQYVPIFGEVDLIPEQYEPLREIAKSAVLTSAPDIRQQIGMLSMADDRTTAHYFWALMLRRDDPKPLNDWIQAANKQELFDFVVKSTEHLHSSVTKIMKDGGVEAILDNQPKFQEFIPQDDLPSGRVTVLGDAAHAMIPLRGAGANTAILDACDLGKLLIEINRHGEDPVNVVSEYLEIMVPRGREAVLLSRAAGNADGDDPAAYFKKFRRE